MTKRCIEPNCNKNPSRNYKDKKRPIIVLHTVKKI